jgi:Transposase and inactivated derivatives
MNTHSYCQQQLLLFPPNIKDKLPDDHLAVIINDIVETLDLSCLYRKVPCEGHPSYHPKMMLKILLYAYATGIFSSRKIAKALQEGIPFIYLSAWQSPDFRTISDFRKNNLEEFKNLFKQVVDICNQIGMIKLGHVAIDGTKIKANASDSKTYNEKRIEKEIEALLKKVTATDEREDNLYGSHCTGDEIPQQIRKRKDRLAKLEQLKTKLTSPGTKKVNRTDPDAVFMKTTSGIKTSYNAQVSVTEECMAIIAHDVVNEASDTNQLKPMVDQSIENTGQAIEKLSSDSGYSSGENLNKLAQKQIDAYIPDPEFQSYMRKGGDPKDNPFHKENFSYNEKEDTYTCPAGKTLQFSYSQKVKGKEPLRMYRCSDCRECPSFSQCTKNKTGRTLSRHPYEKELRAMREKLSTAEGKAIYSKRKKIVEPVFGIIKSVMGFTSFLLRGLQKVKGEFNLISIAYDLRKIASYLKLKQESLLEMLTP